MREGVNAVDFVPELVSRKLRYALRRMVNASDSVDYPDFVPRTNSAILSLVAHKGGHFAGYNSLLRSGGVLILNCTRQPGCEIVRMNPGACGDILGSATNGESVFAHRFAFSDVVQRNLVTRGNFFRSNN